MEAKDLAMAFAAVIIGGLIGLLIGLWEAATISPVPLSELL